MNISVKCGYCRKNWNQDKGDVLFHGRSLNPDGSQNKSPCED